MPSSVDLAANYAESGVAQVLEQLDQELRSPRAPGGHAALGESSEASEADATVFSAQP